MMALLLEPLQFTFMSHALLISLVVSIPCALLSVFLVLKGWALMGDAMSHAVFLESCLPGFWGYLWLQGIRRRSILRGGDGIPERQQPNQARYSDGDCFFWHVCRRSDLVYCSQTRRTS